MLLERRCNNLIRISFLLVLVGGGAQLASAQGDSKDMWKDSATGLTWTVKDNGTDLNFTQAKDYCSNLRLGGFSDWRLPSIDELEAFYEMAKKAKGKVPVELNATSAWSGSTNDSGEVWSLYFSYGGRSLTRIGGHGSAGRALCVRTGK
jgi:hypothetical protein